jgi:plasmid stabilization system protein ParE
MGTSKKRASQTRQIRVSNFARQNIEETIKYIAFNNGQPLNAIKVSEAIDEAITRIAVNPFAYKECEQLPTKTKMYRQAVCLSWLIIYKITSSEILILSVIHGARNPKSIRKLRKIK